MALSCGGVGLEENPGGSRAEEWEGESGNHPKNSCCLVEADEEGKDACGRKIQLLMLPQKGDFNKFQNIAKF